MKCAHDIINHFHDHNITGEVTSNTKECFPDYVAIWWLLDQNVGRGSKKNPFEGYVVVMCAFCDHIHIFSKLFQKFCYIGRARLLDSTLLLYFFTVKNLYAYSLSNSALKNMITIILQHMGAFKISLKYHKLRHKKAILMLFHGKSAQKS